MRAWRAGLALLGLAALASCGGGEQVEPFAPTRIVAFGDENSLLDTSPSAEVPGSGAGNGRSYSVNFIDTAADPDVFKCASHPIWTQIIAANFGLTFPQCNPSNLPNSVVDAQGLMRATANARVADVAQQINTFLTTSSFGPQDLVTVYVGMHDILDIYATLNANSTQADLDALAAQARARGAELALQINRIADADGRVIYTTIQDLGLSPFGRKEKADNATGPDRAALLTRLTNEFNLGVKVTVTNDGRKIGLVTGDELSKIIIANPLGNGFSNVEAQVCATTVAVPNCTTTTLVTDGSALTYYWADDRRLSPGGHNRLGLAAVARARGNPF